MIKFYPHDLSKARAVSDARWQAATEKFETYSIPWFAEGILLQLEDAANNGLPDCYKTLVDWFWDLTFDLPWEADRHTEGMVAVRADPRYLVACEKLSARFDFDFKTEFDSWR